MFGLGMNNNGTGLVFAATVLRHMPEVMLPVICYNLIQHVVAGAVTHLSRKPTSVPVVPSLAAAADKVSPVVANQAVGGSTRVAA